MNYIDKSLRKLVSVKKPAPKIISLFSGCGGLDLPFHKSGYDLVWANDFDESSCRTFERNISKNIVHDSIENIDIDSIPDADIVVGGFPCQDFSQIWKKPGLDGTRGNLYTYFAEIVRKKTPKIFIAENVRGLLSANKGLAMETIIKDFRSLNPGYLVIPKLVNFSSYGLSQVRERVLIFGIRKDTAFNISFPAYTHGKNKLPLTTSKIGLKNISPKVLNQEHMNIQPRTIEILKRIPAGGNFTAIDKNDPYYVKGMISHVYRRLHPDEPSKTIIASGGGGTWGYHYPEPRALTNRERARLQGFPDDFVFEGKFGEIRKQIGNAVPPAGIFQFVNSITDYFNGDYESFDLNKIDEHISQISIKNLMAKSNSDFNFYASDLIDDNLFTS